ncbi:hypothetical protein [Paenirhodobacter populi]|uniref:Uncharacterized protein n=1 Tax=Paenirhodobacter populi TaxID=2306993 RepID=A0A443IQA9_9RHOB|nr:hypothetical protein [Sinirhodobacter populi]RWR08483.1 hypothetical protein D2T33_15420 [Sinirhodobacter populi]
MTNDANSGGDGLFHQILARLDRQEMLLERLAAGLPDLLTPALRRATGGEAFLAGEVFRLARTQDEAAAATGMPRPELPEALELSGIWSAHGLSRWLAAREGSGVERVGVEHGTALWCVR